MTAQASTPMMAMEAIREIVGFGEGLVGRLLMVDALSMRFETLRRPARRADRLSSWHLYAVEIDAARCAVPRARVFQALRDAQIGVNVHYIPIHTQPYYRRLGFRPGQFPAAEAYYAQALSLPLFPMLSDGEQDHVVATLAKALQA